MTLVLSVGVIVAALLVARVGGVDVAGVAAGVLSRSAGVDVLGAVLVSLIVVGAFFCGGYVAARMARIEGPRQGVAVWLWALLAPFGLTVAALAGGGGARGVVGALPGAVLVLLGVCLGAMGLLGALLGGETGQRACRGPAGGAGGRVAAGSGAST